MTLTPARIAAWYHRLGLLNDVAVAWDALGGRIDELFDRYVDGVTKVDGVHWEGKAATAAQDRARADRATAADLVDRLNALAKQVTAAYHAIHAPLRRAHFALEALQANKFHIGNDIHAIADPTPSPARGQLLAELTSELVTGADAAEHADAGLRRTIRTAAETMRTLFVSAETLGHDQGRDDARQLVADPHAMTGAQARRLIDAGTLTPRQLSDWRAGREVRVCAAQMDYIRSVSRAFDNTTPHDIGRILDELPPDVGHAVAQTFQIVSSGTVTTGLSAAAVPERGSGALLPSGIRHALTRPDLVTKDIVQVDTAVLDAVRLNGVGDTQAIAKIVAAADNRYKQGSDLNRGLMDAARQYLHAQVRFDHDNKADVLTVDGRTRGAGHAVTEPILRALGPDKTAVEHALAEGADHRGSDFVKDLITHRWSDQGRAASALFQFAPDTDPADGRRTAHIMSLVGAGISSPDAWRLVSEVPGTYTSAGRLNPHLLQTLATSMSPYVSDLAGGARHPGFDISQHMVGWQPHHGFTHTWLDPDNNSSYRGSVHVFALMNTDPTAGKRFNAAALAQILHSETAFATNPSPVNIRYLSTAGTLHGLIDKALQQQLQAQYHDDAEHAKDIYDVKVQAYKTARSILGAGVSVGGNLSELSNPTQVVTGLAGAYSDPIQDWLCGPPPLPERQAHVPAPNFDQDAQAILAARQAQNLPLPPTLHHQYPWAFAPNGRLIPFESVQTDEHQKQHSYTHMLAELGAPDAPAALTTAYANTRAP